MLRIGREGQLVIPHKIRKRLNMSPGDYLAISVVDNKVILSKMDEDINKRLIAMGRKS